MAPGGTGLDVCAGGLLIREIRRKGDLLRVTLVSQIGVRRYGKRLLTLRQEPGGDRQVCANQNFLRSRPE